MQRSLIIVACGALHQLRPACFVEPRTRGCTKSSRDRRLGTIGAKGTLAQQEREFGASRCAHATVRRCLPSVACCASLAFSLTAAVRRRRGVSAGDPGPERRLPVLCARMSSRRRGLSRARLQHDALGWAGPSAADGSLSAPIEEAKKRSARLCGYRGPLREGPLLVPLSDAAGGADGQGQRINLCRTSPTPTAAGAQHS